MARNKVFFHGIGTGIGDMLRIVDAAGIPGLWKSITNEGWIVEAVEVARASGIDHTIIYRGPSPDHDVPNISLDPATAAEQHWALVKSHLPAGVVDNKDLVWIEPTNEMSTNVTDAPGPAWVGEFSYEMAKLMNADGYRALLWGANAGQPEYDDDYFQNFGKFLAYCAEHPDTAGFSVHEGILFGDYRVDPAWNDANHPWIAGRYKFINDAADASGLARPTIVISEWAWSPRDIPTEDKAKDDIEWLSQELAKSPNVLGACLWNLDPGWGGA